MGGGCIVGGGVHDLEKGAVERAEPHLLFVIFQILYV